MRKKQASGIPEDRLRLYDDLIASLPGIERKGKTLPYTSLNGHMFSFLSEDGTLALRLPEKERRSRLEQHGAELMHAHGTVMKEYVSVPAAMLGNAKSLKHYFQLSLDFVSSLKPKAGK